MNREFLGVLEWLELHDNSPTPGMWGMASTWSDQDAMDFRPLLDALLALRGVDFSEWRWVDRRGPMGYIGYAVEDETGYVAGISLGTARMVLPWQGRKCGPYKAEYTAVCATCGR
jgi:hypothetical protein